MSTAVFTNFGRDRALQICHGWQVFQTHQPIEVGCTKKQPSYARLIGNDVPKLSSRFKHLRRKSRVRRCDSPENSCFIPNQFLVCSLVLHF